MNRKTETFALYPVKPTSYYNSIFSFFKDSKNPIKYPNNFRNKVIKIPEYFYIFFSESFKNVCYAYK